jgi:hypothetical protein
MKPFQLDNKMLHHDIDYTPYEGMTFNNWPRYTLLRGKWYGTVMARVSLEVLAMANTTSELLVVFLARETYS